MWESSTLARLIIPYTASRIVFLIVVYSPDNKNKLGLLLFLIKAIPAKVFGKWGVGKRTFFQKGFFPTKQFSND